ncbi:MAG: hypothetical protein KDA96_01205, partial [Planctomycetaceae bacterium]|nr:hypothetical protein [Planctomycetaceae bacterium]
TAPATGSETSRYEQALEQHILRFPDHPSTENARRWLSAVLRRRDRSSAAIQLLDAASSSEVAEQKLEILTELAAVLLPTSVEDALRMPGHRMDSELVSRFIELVDSVPPANTRSDLIAAVPVNTAALVLRILPGQQPTGGENSTKLADQALSRSLELQGVCRPTETDTPATSEKSPEDSVRSLQYARLLAVTFAETARMNLNSQQTNPVLTQLLEQAPEQRQASAAILMFLMSNTDPAAPQDVLLASAVETLLLAERPAAPTVKEQVSELRVSMELAGHATRTRLLETVLSGLLDSSPSDELLSQIAEILTKYDNGTLCSASAAGTTMTTPPPWLPVEAERRFWIQLSRRNPQGSDQWLAGSLRSAEIAASEGRRADALKIVRVVGTLYPDWGCPLRKQRAEAVVRKLNQRTP